MGGGQVLLCLTCTRAHKHRHQHARAHRGRHLPVVQTGLSRPDSAQGSRSPWFSRYLRDLRWKLPQRPSTERCRAAGMNTHRHSSKMYKSPHPQKTKIPENPAAGDAFPASSDDEKTEEEGDVRGSRCYMLLCAVDPVNPALDPSSPRTWTVRERTEGDPETERQRLRPRRLENTAAEARRTESGTALSVRPSVKRASREWPARRLRYRQRRPQCDGDTPTHTYINIRASGMTADREAVCSRMAAC